jgi:hypothetical protein
VPIIDAYTLLGAWPETDVELSVEALAAGMQARGVGRCLVTHTTAIFYDTTLGNDQALALGKQHQAVIPVAVVNPLRYPGCLDEAERYLAQGVHAFRLCPREHDYPFSASVGPLVELLGRLSRARLLLVDVSGVRAPGISADIVSHLPVPTAFTTTEEGLGLVIEAGKRSQNVLAETSALDAGGAVEAAAKHLGVNRVLFGSAAPLKTLGAAVMSVQYAELPEPDRAAIFEGNVQRIMAG